MKKKVATIATAAILSTTFASSAFAETYTVQKGDTLSHIARAYSTTVSELKSLNSLKSDLIYPNQKLTVNNPAATTVPAPAPAQSSTPKATPATYTVVSGDTLSQIARKHNISLSSLMTWNKLSNHLIYPGQKLAVTNPARSAEPAPVAAPAPAPQPVVKAPAAEGKSEAAGYTIQPGDTLGKIASKFNLTVQQLKALNQLSSDLIYAGKTLKVSGQPSPKETTGDAPAVTDNVQKLISEATKLVGTPYVWGGTSPSGFDCSGFIYYALKQAGINLPRTSSEGYYNRSYYVNTPQPGDFVFFENTYKQGISHMGIYIGNNEFVHADNSGVRITSLDNSYYKKYFESFKRLY